MIIHTVKKNESLSDIAEEYDVSLGKLCEDNGGLNPSHSYSGRELVILRPTRSYAVRHGDTLSGVAKRFSVSENDLLLLNPSLRGRKKIYQGETLTVKQQAPRWGSLGVMGYLYKGTKMQKLLRCMPYMTYVTVASACVCESGIKMLFDGTGYVELIKNEGKTPLIRIYFSTEELPKPSRLDEIITSIALFAGAGGFQGVVLAKGRLKGNKEELCELVFKMRKRFIECDLALYVEENVESSSGIADYADGAILYYDKLEKSVIPTFKDGEERAFRSYADSFDGARAFLFLGAYAYCEGQYISRENVYDSYARRKSEVENDRERMVITERLGKKKKELKYESLENTKSRLELAGELGFTGVAFDIMRISIEDLIVLGALYSPVQKASLVTRGGKCNG